MEAFRPHLDGFQDTSNQLAAHLWSRAEECFARSAREKAAIQSVPPFEERRRRLQAHFLDAIGGLPELPDTVSAECTRTHTDQDFRIEMLWLQTLPGVRASANLYLPHERVQPVPAVLFLCGHATGAKTFPEYQRVCRALARSGIAVLALDPVGLGERGEFLDRRTGRHVVPRGTPSHGQAGRACHAAGFSVVRYFLADAMQALTYLAARPEIDPGRLGVTGSSGGGTQSSYLMFVDPRLRCGMPCNWITSREADLPSGQPHDAEDIVWACIREGLDYDDLLSGMAPRPVMIGACASDFFSVDGAVRTFDRLSAVYGMYGAEGQVYLTISPGPHAYSDVLRDRAVLFFRRHLLGHALDLPSGIASYAPADESPIAAVPMARPQPESDLPEEALWVTRSGQTVLDHPEAATVFDLNLAAWGARARDGDAGGMRGRRACLERAVLADRPRPPMWVRETDAGMEPWGLRWYHRYLRSEPGIFVSMTEVRGGGIDADADILVLALPQGTDAVPARRNDIMATVRACGRVLAYDARGQSAASQRGITPYAGPQHGALYRLNYDAMMLGDSLLAMQAFDALRVLEYARRIAGGVRVAGEGMPGLALLLAAAIDGRVAGGRFTCLPASWGDVVTQRFFPEEWLLDVHGLTEWPDIPELLSSVPGSFAEGPRFGEAAAEWRRAGVLGAG